jgi:predicted RNase H-related nuclease YkuK (DUF458 family)
MRLGMSPSSDCIAKNTNHPIIIFLKHFTYISFSGRDHFLKNKKVQKQHKWKRKIYIEGKIVQL